MDHTSKCKTIKLGNRRKFGLGKAFLDTILKAQYKKNL